MTNPAHSATRGPAQNCSTPRANGEGSVATSRRGPGRPGIMGADPAGLMVIRAARAAALMSAHRRASENNVYQAAQLERLGRKLPGLLEGACEVDKPDFVSEAAEGGGRK